MVLTYNIVYTIITYVSYLHKYKNSGQPETERKCKYGFITEHNQSSNICKQGFE